MPPFTQRKQKISFLFTGYGDDPHIHPDDGRGDLVENLGIGRIKRENPGKQYSNKTRMGLKGDFPSSSSSLFFFFKFDETVVNKSI